MSLSSLPIFDPRVPSWGQESMRARHCPICENQVGKTKFVRPDGLGVVHCSTCQIFFVSPAPNQERLASFYAEYDALHRVASNLRPEEARRIFDTLDPLLDVRIQKLLSLGPLVNKDVLDVGFGRGQFLYLCKRLGARTQGLELDPASIEFARHLGLDNVQLGTLDSRGLLNCIDVVVFNDLIEHPLDPRSLLVAASRSLRLGGHILVWTPNGQAHFSDPEKITFRVDLEHMQYFTPASVAYLANDLGLEVVHLETLGYPALEQFQFQRGTSVRLLTKLKSIIRWILGAQVKTNLSKILKRNRPLISDSRLGCYHMFFVLRKKGTETP